MDDIESMINSSFLLKSETNNVKLKINTMSSIQIKIKRTNSKTLTKVEESFTIFQRFMLVNRKKIQL